MSIISTSSPVDICWHLSAQSQSFTGMLSHHHRGASLETFEPLHVRQLQRTWPWHPVQTEIISETKEVQLGALWGTMP